ncbi:MULTISPECIES: hypothetical protein [Halocynthiibacter]|uniref:Uncharacterized protein n=1 Tax=Halocynthiibacter halioticoli TaxID=2986804 RepID=A0AAE3LTU7_9RHOB|nr:MULTISPECIES: hypothetical protein [Halocynthiibacter]MCV6825791.1 hypothetical protein [Halocynthiibacter halioticoli]MCW4058792.1 hypothetical protein [Halocynthiibacter sp. SDUM655004]
MFVHNDEIFCFPHMTRDLFFPICVIMLGVFLLSGTMLSHDISWYLISTRWWLDGLPIYEEIFELNPPLAFYLTAIPVWISGVSGLSEIAVYKAFVFALISVSLLTTWSLFRNSPTITPLSRRIFLGVAAVGLVLLPIGDFGQRDHLFTIFFLPFLVMSLLENPPSKAQRAGIAIWAVLGVALKHYFLLLPLIILIYKVLSARSLRPTLRIEFVLPAALLVAYVIASYILHPAYFDSVIPRTLQLYGAFDTPFSDMLVRSNTLIAVLAFALVLMALTPQRNHATALVILVGASAIAAYLFQSKGWNYQRIPANFYVVLAVTWAATGLAHARQHWWPMLSATLAIGVLLVPALRAGPYTNTFATNAAPYFICPPGQRSFQIFSSTVSSGFPLANLAQAEPANRAPTLWLFPGASYLLSQTENSIEQANYRAILNDAREMVLDDFFRTRPQVVIVDTSPDKAYFNGAAFDYLDYFQQVDKFSIAWNTYQHRGMVGTYDIYSRPGCEL